MEGKSECRKEGKGKMKKKKRNRMKKKKKMRPTGHGRLKVCLSQDLSQFWVMMEGIEALDRLKCGLTAVDWVDRPFNMMCMMESVCHTISAAIMRLETGYKYPRWWWYVCPGVAEVVMLVMEVSLMWH